MLLTQDTPVYGKTIDTFGRLKFFGSHKTYFSKPKLMLQVDQATLMILVIDFKVDHTVG